MNCRIVHEGVGHSLWHLRLQFSSPLYHTYPFRQTPTLLARNKSIIDGKTSERPSVPKILVVQPRLRPGNVLQAKLSEALSLANSLDDQQDDYFSSNLKPSPSHVVVQNPLHFWSRARAATYFGKGTVETIGCRLTALQSEDNVDAVFVNATLTGTQLRNLEKAWDMPVLDRVGLIIEIFHAHAYTKEAKLQAELAALMYKRTRLVREHTQGGRGTFGARGESAAEIVSARGRGSGGRGFISGAGETELELQRRRIMERRNYLIAEIEEVRRTRALQRSSRRRPVGADGEGLATVAVVGYTNAGKSTLVSALSHSDLYIDDRLFATVDPKLRGVTLPSGRNVLLSDTVGFISDLPLQLVEAFHATLEEVVEADLLVHVVDSSSTNVEEQRSAVLHVLQQIGVAEKKIHNMIEVWNKIDLHEELVDSVNHLDDGDVDDEEEEVNVESGHPCDEIEIEGRQSEEEEDDEEAEVRRDNFSPAVDYKHRQNESSCNEFRCERVKTSALMGLGLRDLLEVIDLKLEKVQDNVIIERGEFNRKWRPPPRCEDG